MADDPIPVHCPECGAEMNRADRDKPHCHFRCGSWWDRVGLQQSDLCRINVLTAENSRLRVMAELLEQCECELELPMGLRIAKYNKGCWFLGKPFAWNEKTHPTARAAIYAAMGWEKGEGT